MGMSLWDSPSPAYSSKLVARVKSIDGIIQINRQLTNSLSDLPTDGLPASIAATNIGRHLLTREVISGKDENTKDPVEGAQSTQGSAIHLGLM